MTSKVDFIRIYIEQYMKREKRRHSVKNYRLKTLLSSHSITYSFLFPMSTVYNSYPQYILAI